MKTDNSRNSYAAHCPDPLKAAQEDLLGQLVKTLREVTDRVGCTCDDGNTLCDQCNDAVESSRNLLKQFGM